jgi:hypothetical protein
VELSFSNSYLKSSLLSATDTHVVCCRDRHTITWLEAQINYHRTTLHSSNQIRVIEV